MKENVTIKLTLQYPGFPMALSKNKLKEYRGNAGLSQEDQRIYQKCNPIEYPEDLFIQLHIDQDKNPEKKSDQKNAGAGIEKESRQAF